MTRPLLLFFPGAGGGDGAGEAAGIQAAFPDFDVVAIGYSGWRKLAHQRAAMDRVLAHAQHQAEVADRDGPIVLLGYSLGAQIGLAIAHRLGDAGRQIDLFCALDGKLVSSDRPERGWVGRAIGDLRASIASGGLGGAGVFAASRFSRLFLRLAGDRLPILARRWARHGRLPWLLAANPAFAGELKMRLLIAAAVPWMQRLPLDLPPLDRPAMLLRVPASADFDADWRILSPAIEIVALDGEHGNLLETDQLERIAARVRAAALDLGVMEERSKAPQNGRSPT